MKIKRKRSYKKSLIIVAAVGLVLIIGGIVTYVLIKRNEAITSQVKPTNTVNYGNPTDEQKNAGTDTKQQSLGKDNTTPTPAAPPATTPTNSKQQVGVILSINQPSDTVQIRAVIQALDGGTCNLQITRNGQTILTRSANVSPQTSYSTCQGFDVARSEIGVGDATVIVNFESTTYKGSASQAVKVN